MGTLSNAGYTPTSIIDLNTQLTNEAIAQVPGFTALPSELRTDLIQESVITLSKFENAISDLMNGIAPTFANDFVFQQFAQSFGLVQNPATTTEVILAFSGAIGTYIPKGTVCSNAGDTIEVTTEADAIIGTTGTASITASTTQIVTILANTITTIKVAMTGITVNNPNAGTDGKAAETTSAFRSRVINTLSAPRIGQVARLYELLKAIPAVNQRLIFVRNTTVTVVTA